MKNIAIIAALAASLDVTGAAHAGLSTSPPTVVILSPGNSIASQGYGALNGARRTSDKTQSIGCEVAATFDGWKYVSCYARNAQGNYASCYKVVPGSLQALAVSAVNTTTYIYFMGDRSGQCTYLSLTNESALLSQAGN